MKRFLFVFFQLILCFSTFSQKFSAFSIDIEKGLRSSNVYRVFQDHHNYIWLATEDGLYRYDGSELKLYSNENGLLSDIIIDIGEDLNQQLWVFTYHGSLQYLKGEHFYEQKSIYGKWPGTVVRCKHINKRDWGVAAPKLFCRYQDSIKEVQPLKNRVRFHDIINWGADTLVANTDSGILLYTSQSGWERYFKNKLPKVIKTFCIGPRNNLWLAHSKGVLCFRNNRLDTIVQFDTSLTPNNILVDQTDRIWISDLQSRSLFLIQNETFKEVTSLVDERGLQINHMLVDKQQNLWLSTFGLGAICVSSTEILNFPIDHVSLNSEITSIVCTDSSTIIASRGTISQFKDNELSPIVTKHHQAENFPYFTKIVDEKVVVGNESRSFSIEEKEGYLQSTLIYENPSLDFLKTSWGDYMLGGYIGLRIDTGKGPDSSLSKIRDRVYVLIEWDSSVIVGTNSGLYQLKDGRERRIFPHENAKDNFINTAFVSSDNTLWIATANNCFTLKKAKEKIIHTVNDRLKSIRAFAEGKDGNIWMGSKYGLIHYKDGKIKRFGQSQGLPSSGIKAIAIDSSEFLWLATSVGVSRISMSIFNEAQSDPTVLIEKVIYDTNCIFFPKELVLSTVNKNISISFSSPYFPSNEHAFFEYQLTGFDSSWFELKAQNILFASLPEGEYTLKVRPLNSTQKMIGGLKLIVKAPFYQQRWFYFCLYIINILLLVFVGWFILKKREQINQRKLKQRLRVNLLKTQALQAMINPHFIFNSLTSVLSLVQSNKKEEVEEYVEELSTLLRAILEGASSSTIPIQEEIKNLKLYLQLEKVRFGKRLAFEILCDPALDDKIRIPNMLLQPFVENAIVHGISKKIDGGKVFIGFQKKEKALEITIEDDGVGIQASNPSKLKKRSLGTKLIQQRLELMKEISGKPFTLKIYKRLPTGVIIRLVLGI